MNPTITIP
jgi:hypothetical protein